MHAIGSTAIVAQAYTVPAQFPQQYHTHKPWTAFIYGIQMINNDSFSKRESHLNKCRRHKKFDRNYNWFSYAYILKKFHFGHIYTFSITRTEWQNENIPPNWVEIIIIKNYLNVVNITIKRLVFFPYIFIVFMFQKIYLFLINCFQ